METKFAAVNSRRANYYFRICNMINKENKTKKTSNMNGLKKLSVELIHNIDIQYSGKSPINMVEDNKKPTNKMIDAVRPYFLVIFIFHKS